jgi:hypothetical protein
VIYFGLSNHVGTRITIINYYFIFINTYLYMHFRCELIFLSTIKTKKKKMDARANSKERAERSDKFIIASVD